MMHVASPGTDRAKTGRDSLHGVVLRWPAVFLVGSTGDERPRWSSFLFVLGSRVRFSVL